MDCPPTPQFCLDFLLRSKTYLKECPPSASIANREFPLTDIRSAPLIQLFDRVWRAHNPHVLDLYIHFAVNMHNFVSTYLSYQAWLIALRLMSSS